MAVNSPMAMPMGGEKDRTVVPARTRTSRISSVAYATEDRLSEAKMARAGILDRRS